MSLLNIVGKELRGKNEPGSVPLNFSEFNEKGFVAFENVPFSEVNTTTGEAEMFPMSIFAKMKRDSSSLEWLEDL